MTSSTVALLHEMLHLIPLVDDEEAVGPFDHVLDLAVLMAGHYGETIPLTSHPLVLLECHQDAAFASLVPPALALELELVLRVRPRGRAFVDRGALVVHGAHQALVAGLSLEPLLHGPESYA